MIPMACPNCGRRGSVPPDKLNSRLHCKKCDAVFHMDASGHVVLGEPGSSERKSDSVFGMKATATKPRAAKDEPMDLFGNLKDAWTGIPLAGRIVIGVLAACIAIWSSGVTKKFGRMFQGHPIPATLAERAEYVADAFVDDSPGRLGKIAAAGTEADATAWMAKVRPGFKHSGPRQQGNLVTYFAPTILQEDGGKKEAKVLMILAPPRPDPTLATADKGYFAPGYRDDGTYALPTLWTLDDQGKWRFDGKAALANATNPSTAKDDPEPKGSSRGGGGSHRGRR